MKPYIIGALWLASILAVIWAGLQLYTLRVTVLRSHAYAFDKLGPTQVTEDEIIMARDFLASPEGVAWAAKYDDTKTTEGERSK